MIAQKNGKSKLHVKEMGVRNDFAKSFRFRAEEK
jgi:hypothetical protein